MSPKVVVNQSNLKVVVNKSNNTVEVTSPGPQGNFYNSFKGDWSSATAYFVGDIVFYNGSSYVATANSTNSQPPSASWSAVAKGIPGGGTTGQIIVKNSSTDYDYSWTNNYTINTTSPLTGGAAINTNPTLAINATSDDTASYVVQRDANQSFAIGAVRFDTSSVQTTAVGKLYWDGNETLNLGLGSTGTVTIAVGQEVINYVTNAEATTLNVGEVVYLFGAQGDRPSVKRASNTSDATSAKTFGIVAESITAGGAGFVINKGIVSKVNTSAYNPGDILWLGATPGTFTTTKPVAPNHLVFVGVVLRSNAGNGLVYVAPQNGYELEEIHDVLITSPTDGQFLTYESSTDLWKNKGISATAPITYNAGTRTIAANAASTSAAGVVQLTDSTSSTSTTTAATPNSVKIAYDLAAAAIPLSQKAAANGVATLDASGLVPTNQLPALAITNTFVVASQAAMLALTAETGDVAIRTDLNKSFILTATPASTLANWQELLTPPDAVTSVDGRVGAVTLTDKYAQLATANTFTGGLQQINTANASTTGLVIKASASQSANLQVWQDSSSNNLVGIGGTGGIFINRSVGSATTGLIMSTGATTNVGIRVDGVASQTGDLQQWRDSSGNVLALVNASGFGTFGNLVVTSSTVPTNGIYLPAANTLGFATNSAERMRIDSSGRVGIGATPSAGNVLRLGLSVSGINDANAVFFPTTIASDVTAQASLFRTLPGTAAASFTLGQLFHFRASQGGIGASSAITSQYGFTVDSSLTGANSNFGFYGDIPSAANRWNFYANGTAANYFAGQTTVGSTSLTLGSGSVAQQFGVVAGAATTVGAVIRGAASQTANLTEWQNSAGGIVLRVDSAGGLRGTYIMSGNTGSGVLGQITSYAESATTVGLAIRGAASQTANLTEWQNSAGSLVAWVNVGGDYYGRISYIGNASDYGAITNINTFSTTRSGIIIRAVASQTADLQQWQNSSGTVLSYVRNDGVIFATQGLQGTAWLSAGTYISGANLISNIGTATNVGVLTRGAASQSADLVQLQDSSGNILNSIDNSGNIRSEAQLIQYGAEGSLIQNIPTRVHPAETLLKQAVWWIDAAHTSASSQTINNLGWGGSALNVTNGSSTAADSNDAQYLAWDGVNYVYLPGVNSSYLSVPDAANLDITNDIDIRAYITMDDWTPAVNSPVITKWLSAGDQRGFIFEVTTTGGLNLQLSANGLAQSAANSTTTMGLTDGTSKWIRATYRRSDQRVQFFTSDNGTSWTQLGTDVTSAQNGIFSNTADIGIGTFSSGATAQVFAGKIYRAQILNGIDGVPVLDIDTSVISTGAATSFAALTGQTVTIARGTSGRKTVCVTNPLWLFGTDDYMEVNNRWLEHTGSNYLYLPGVLGNDATTPDSAAISITGDIDIRCKVALDDWTPSNNTGLVTKQDNAYYFYVATDGRLRFAWSPTGGAWIDQGSSVVSGIADGTTKWVRATLDVDNGASGYDLRFFTSDDGTTWTQLGTTVTNAGITSIFNGNAVLRVGGAASGDMARGKFFRAQVLNGIGGTVAFDANFETGITSNLPTTFTESSANAATVTVNYSGTGYRSAGVIASTYVYPGNPNTFKLSTTSLLDFTSTQSFSAFFVARQWATPTSFGNYLNKKDNSANTGSGYRFSSYAAGLQTFGQIADGTNFTPDRTGSVLTSGTIMISAGVVDRNAQTFLVNQNGVASTTASLTGFGAISSPFSLRIGQATSTGTGTQDFEFISAAIWRRALTAAEIATLNNYFQGRVA